MNVIEVHGLEKVYNDSEVKVYALNGVDLIIHEGEFTAIVGPSGSGSTNDQRVVNKARRVITLEDGKIISDTRK